MFCGCSEEEIPKNTTKPVSNVYASENCTVTVLPDTDLSPGDTVDFKVHIQARCIS